MSRVGGYLVLSAVGAAVLALVIAIARGTIGRERLTALGGAGFVLLAAVYMGVRIAIEVAQYYSNQAQEASHPGPKNHGS
jgi:hypothetical protein